MACNKIPQAATCMLQKYNPRYLLNLSKMPITTSNEFHAPIENIAKTWMIVKLLFKMALTSGGRLVIEASMACERVGPSG